MLSIIEATRPEHIAAVKSLFLEYAHSLGFSLCFQSFDQELAELPGMYGPPDGRLLLAAERGNVKRTAPILLLLLLAVSAFAQTSAIPAKEGPEATEVSFPSGDETIKGFLYVPGKGVHGGQMPAIVVIHEWWGLNDW